jgi:6-phosphogluconolactonase
VHHHSFNDREALARRLAADVARSLRRRLDAHGEASLVVSGGRTPATFLRELGRQPLDWPRVHVTLADERRVPRSDAASNLALVRDAFAGSAAAQARLVDVDAMADDASARWSAIVSDLPRPFAAVVLGMGDDGHFASLFPGMPGLATALASTSTAEAAAVVEGVAPVEPRARLSLTLATLLDTDLLALHVTGASKLATLQRASQPGSTLEMPVRALLAQRRARLEIYHAA